MRHMKLVAAMLVVLLAGYAYAAGKMPEGVQARKSDAGVTVLADAKGMTLYTFDKDMPGKSNCAAKCLMAWPALVAGDSAKDMGDWTVVTRDDGSKLGDYSAEAACRAISSSATAQPNCAGLQRETLAVRSSMVFASSGVTFSTVWRITVGYFSVPAQTAR